MNTPGRARRPRAVRLAAAAFLPLALSGCYLLKQGNALLGYQLRARPTADLLARGEATGRLREVLLQVEDIRAYSARQVGLKPNRNYTRYVQLDRDYLADVVSASARDRFEPYLWRFPFFGAFPYKGFFDRRDAEREAQRLRRLDLDVFTRQVDAFSTLGFFKDPLYSFMVNYSAFELAELIIHEQTHATRFLRNQVQFNEEMATFVGREGALGYVRQKMGADSECYRQALLRLEDEDTFYRLIGELHGRLEAVYAGGADRETKLREKARILEEFRREMSLLPQRVFRTEAFRDLFDRLPLNNATILAMMAYTGDLSLFYRLYERLGRDLKRTVEFLLAIPQREADPHRTIRKFLGEPAAARPPS